MVDLEVVLKEVLAAFIMELKLLTMVELC